MIRCLFPLFCLGLASLTAADPAPVGKSATQPGNQSKPTKPEKKPEKKPVAIPGEFPFQPRLRPKPGEVFVFRSYSYLDGWFEFHDSTGNLWPTYVYQRKTGPLSGSFIFDPIASTMAFRLVCNAAVNTGGDQSNRVLGEWTAGGHPRIVLTIDKCGPWQAAPDPGVDANGKARRTDEGFYTTVTGTLAIQGDTVPITSLARLNFSTIYKDPEIGVAKAMSISGQFTMYPSELGLRHPGLTDKVRISWSTQANLQRHVASVERSTATDFVTIKPLPPAPLIVRRVLTGVPTIPEIPATEKAAQEAFKATYYTSMDVAKRRTALLNLKGLTDPTTRDMLAQVCYMERDDQLAILAMEMLATFPDRTMQTGEIVATVLQNAPGGLKRAALYAGPAAACPVRSPLLGWFSRAVSRTPWTPVPMDNHTKKPKTPPEPTNPRYPSWLEANRNREAWEKILPAFNAFAKTNIPLDEKAMAAVKAWIDTNSQAVLEADLARASSPSTP